MAREVSLIAYPWVHFGLIDLGSVTPRAYGGAGASFSAWPVRTRAERSPRFGLTSDSEPLTRLKVTAAFERAAAAGLDTRAALSITAALPAHVGFGAGTATVLSALAAVARLHDWPTSPADLVKLSGRGRTSGVGSAAFFTGGFVVDAGQRGHPVDGCYRPSHDPQDRPPSTTTGSWPIPADWRISLVIPELRPTVAPDAEGGFFRSNTPVSSEDVLWQIAHLYHGMLPALAEADLPAFARSLAGYQRRGFKQAEIAAQPESVRQVIADAWELGLAAGLSSLGPAVFLVHDAATAVTEIGLDLNGCSAAGPFEFRTSGASCEVRES
ncbi:beta-ribofuranosylaminobenzene 5'-phosphate synthase family protein [Lentzea sp. JNUCC 0626]|uniref:beta-ribofuranosylaminobenzene 5'-phosphate synthase family protein n=1 Tax=Lentzea sp. JNUCC 0626 TaxID=3367513 RepID=UPI0037482B20